MMTCLAVTATMYCKPAAEPTLSVVAGATTC